MTDLLSELAAPAGSNTLVGNLYADLRPVLIRALVATSGSYSGVEDAVQEAFVALLRSGQQDILVPTGWLYRVAVRHLRRQQRRHRLADILWSARPAEDTSLLDQVAGRLDLIALLAQLPVRDRQLLVAKYYLGLRQDEIADTFGMPRGTVSAALSRSTRRIRQLSAQGAP